MKILFVLKEKNQSGGYSAGYKGGLYNSIQFLAEALQASFGIDVKTASVIDSNGIDKEVHNYRPDLVILEAIWCPPYKLDELATKWHEIQWIVRVHSKTPFLANEGIAVEYLKAYAKIWPKVIVGFNTENTTEEFRFLGRNTTYLPNIYVKRDYSNDTWIPTVDIIWKDLPHKGRIEVGCFGAIRPMKNQLIQAIAAIKYAERRGKKLNFHINSVRIEQGGDPVLKNLRALFDDSDHALIEWPWLSHSEFTALVKKMDVGLQCSLSESFNIVAADFVANDIPLIGSKDIEWLSSWAKVDPTDAKDIISGLNRSHVLDWIIKSRNKAALSEETKDSIETWRQFLRKYSYIDTV